VRYHGIRFLGAATAAGAALLIVSAAGALAAPSSASAPSGFGSHQLVKAGSFSEVAEAVDSNGKVHIAAGNDLDVWYITNAAGSWAARKIFVHTAIPNGYAWGQPSITLDANDRVYIAATRFPYGEGGEGIFFATNQGHTHGTFGGPTKIAPAAYGEPQLRVYNGDLYLVAVKNWCCVGDGTVVMRTDKSGPWTTATIGAGQNPSFQMTSDGFARVLYERGDTATGLYYAAAGTHKDSFTTAHIAGTNSNDGGPLLALTLNTAQITWRHFDNGAGNWKFTYSTQGGWHSFFTVPGSTANMDGAIAALPTGYAHVALAGANVTDHYRCGSVPPGTWCSETVASNAHSSAVASAGGPSHAIDIAWIQSGDIWFASEHFPGP
jgi:hypothetical protein